MVIFY